MDKEASSQRLDTAEQVSLVKTNVAMVYVGFSLVRSHQTLYL